MKKKVFLIIAVASVFFANAQDINDALRYSSGQVVGSARYRALSGAFGALGGDLSAVNVNPASSAVFTNSFASVSLNIRDVDNETVFFGGTRSSSDSDVSLNQAGGVFVFKNRHNNSMWKKFTFSVAFDNLDNYDDSWESRGINGKEATQGGSIASYFLNNAQGLNVGDISPINGQSYSDAYADIGSVFGVQNQQAFLGYSSFILDLDPDGNNETEYVSLVEGNSFDQRFGYLATGYNGKIAFNFGAQYGDNLYLGLNLNSHFLNYEKLTVLEESNNETGGVINNVYFENVLNANGSGFSFQLGGIYKLTNEFRIGLTYDSPTWFSIEEESTQYLETSSIDGIPLADGSTFFGETINPQVINVFEPYNLQSPGKITGSLAYVFGKKGLISFDYSRKDYSKTKFTPKSDAYFRTQNSIIADRLTAASTFKLGGEYKVNQFSFRGGYRFEESPYKNGVTVGDLSGYSLGLGYDFGNTKLDVTYDAYSQSREHQLYNTGLTDSAFIDANNSNITLSLGFSL